MSNKHRWAKRLAQLVVAASAMIGIAWGEQAVASASTLAIPDISEWQGKLTASQVSNLKSQVSFVINRRQYGSAYQDLYAANNTALYVKYGIPFGEYDYARFTSAASARQEAKDFYNRSNKNTSFYALDFEENDVTSGTTNAAVKAWYDEMRSLTSKNLVFYSYQSFATSYANTARQNFDAQWIANYSYTPMISFALWQYTDHNYLSALSEYTDNSKAVTSVHPISWWTDSVTTALSSVTYAYSGYKVGQHIYLHSNASKYADGTKIAKSDRQKFYRISKVKNQTQSRSKQALYIGDLGKWVLSQDGTGYFVGQHGSYTLKHKLNLYSDSSLTKKTGSYYVSGDTVAGKLVKAPSGKSYRVKTSLGYLSANVKFMTPAYYESLSSTKTIKTKKKVYEYKKSSFAKSSRSKAVTKGTKLKVTAVKKRSTGSRYFVLSNGKYVTALKSYVTE